MKARWNEHTLADSSNTHTVGGFVYFPRHEVRMELLAPVAHTEDDLSCPDGVQFFDVVTPTGRSVRSAWSYVKARPGQNKAPVEQWIAFWQDVVVQAG